MPDSGLPDSGSPPLREPGSNADPLEQLRELLVGPEQRRLEEVQRRLDDGAIRAREVGKILPSAISLAASRDARLGHSLTPLVETSLKNSIRRDPTVIVDAVFPVIGPAIRKALRESLANLFQTINQTLEHGLSWRAWRWRLEAARTGKSFAEVVLFHTLVFRVEELFLTHRPTGQVLLHARGLQAPEPGPERLASTLTAVQRLVADSLRDVSGEALQKLQLGDREIWIEHGPSLTLAAVLRGEAPTDFRTVLQSHLERIHLAALPLLDPFVGRPEAFEVVRPDLEACLQSQFRNPGRPSCQTILAAGALVLIGLLIWLAVSFAERREWQRAVHRLRATEGLVVLTSRTHGRHHVLEGLRDPLASDPRRILAESGIDTNRVIDHWHPFQAITPSLVVRRARIRQPPPPDLDYHFEAGRLIIRGLPDPDWFARAKPQLESLAGVDEVVIHPDPARPAPSTADLVAAIEGTTLFFRQDIELAPDQEKVIRELADRIRRLRESASLDGRTLRIQVRGHTDPTGPPALHRPLSLQRAQVVANRLVSQGLPVELFVLEAQGDSDPLPPEASGDAADLTRNRRVSLRVNPESSG